MRRFSFLTAIIVAAFFCGYAGTASALPPLAQAEVYSDAAFDAPPAPAAANTNGRVGMNVAKYGMTRGEIKSLPILERPNRLGHFYGNTVRRRAGGE